MVRTQVPDTENVTGDEESVNADPVIEPMRAKTFFHAAVLLCLLPFPLAAQTIPSPYRFWETRQEAGPFAGWISPGTGRFGYGPAASPLVGARYGLDFPGPLSIEGVVNWIPTTRDVVDPRREEGQRVIGSSDASLLGVDARLKLSLTGQRTWHGLNPFALAGAGLMWDLADPSADEEELEEDDRFELGTAFVGQLGGGLRVFLSDHWIVRTDALLHVWKLDTPAGFRDVSRGFGDVGASEWVNASSVSVGAAYRF
jgi:hypothetical protein